MIFQSPTERTAYSRSSVTVRGVAKDDVGLRRVDIRVGLTSPWTNLHTAPPSPVRKAWSHTVNLSPGLNLLQVRAMDRAGHVTFGSL